MKNTLYLLICTCLLLVWNPVCAQQDYHRSSAVSLDAVLGFAEDANGMIWIATNNGLIRYNGSYYIKYNKNSSASSIPDNYVNGLLLDGHQQLFFSTNGGFCKYDYGKGFISEDLKADYKPTFCMVDYKDDKFFICSSNGLEMADKQTLKRTQLCNSIEIGGCLHMAFSSKGVLGGSNTYNHNVCFLSGDFKSIKSSIKATRPSDIVADVAGDFWFRDYAGLHYVNGSSLTESELPDWMSPVRGKSLFLLQLKDNQLIVGVQNDCIYSFDLTTHKVQVLDYNADIAQLSDAFIDSKYNLWAKNKSTAELDFYPLQTMKFSVSSDLRRLILQHQGIINLFQLESGRYLIKMRDNHLFQYETNSQQFLQIQSQIQHDSFYGDINNLWSSNITQSTLSRLQLTGNQLVVQKQYKFDKQPMNLHVVSPTCVKAIFPDSLLFITPEQIQTVRFPSSYHIRYSYYDAQHDMVYLISLSDGIYAMDHHNEFSQIFDNKKFGLSQTKYFCVDRYGNYWIGTITDGVYKYLVKEDKLEHYNMDNGLSDNSVVHLLLADDYLLVPTVNGLNSIHTQTGTIRKHFNGRNNLANKYIQNVGFYDTDGTAYLASQTGIVHVDPQMTSQGKEVPVYLENILINNQMMGWVSPDHTFYSNQFGQNGKVRLSYDQNNLEFNFCGIDYENSSNLVYSYRLVGLSEEWTNTTNMSVTYPKLPEGDYRFEVRVMSESNEWSEPVSFAFTVNPPLWWTWWSKLLYFILLVSAAAWGINHYTRWQLNRKTLRFMEQDSLVNKRMSDMKINFFTNISHEFRTPLTLITSPLKQLKDEERPEEKAFLYSIIERNVQKMLRLTEDLLKYNRKDSFQPQLDLSFANLTDFLKETISIFQFNAEVKGITIHAEEMPELDCSFDAPKLNDVLSNLFTNAIKYSPRNKDIFVSMKQVEASHAAQCYGMENAAYDNYVEICVKDQGIGITNDQKESIFHRYERVDGAEELTGSKGFGIGLHYTRQLIEFLEGSIKVTDNPAGGSIFSFIIPLIGSEDSHYETQHASNGEDPAAIHERYASKKVLIVEDDIDMRIYLERMLKDFYAIACVSNGQECLDYMKENAVDLIICDRMMPVMDGDTLCKNLKGNKENQNLPVIMLTAKTDRVSKIQGINLGVDAYITKPFDLDYLIANVNNLLEKRMQIQQQILNFTPQTLDEPENKEAVKTLSKRDEEFLKQLYALIDEHLHEVDFKINSLYKEMAMSHTKFYTTIKNLTGENPSNLYTAYRMNKALEMLKSKNFTISEIADKTGFSTLASFSRAFKDYFGTAPTKY